MPVNPLTGASLPYGPGIGSPFGGASPPPMWAGGGAGPGFPVPPPNPFASPPPQTNPFGTPPVAPPTPVTFPSAPSTPVTFPSPPQLGGAQGAQNPFIQQLLAMIRARRQSPFRPGPTDSLIPAGNPDPFGSPSPAPPGVSFDRPDGY